MLNLVNKEVYSTGGTLKHMGESVTGTKQGLEKRQ